MAKQLTQAQRYYICLQIASHVRISKIAKALKVDRSTVYREVKRNSRGINDYDSDYASKLANIRKSKASKQKAFKSITPKIKKYMEEKLLDKWSPEVISGRIKKDIGVSISHETIYSYIRDNRQHGGKLYKLLPHRGKKYKYGSHRTTIIDRVDISKRPKIVEKKVRIGDFELDTMLSAKHTGKSCLFTMVDRRSKTIFIRKTIDKSADKIQLTLEDIYMNTTIPIITTTSDNGTEFANHKEISTNIGCEHYFARPYRSCDRGLNEHMNGQIRRYLPKGTNFDTISNEEIQEIENALNNRPRKSLNYRTPNEVVNKYLQRISKNRIKNINSSVAFDA